MNDPNAPIDPSTMDPDELAIVQMLEEDKLEARRKDAFALMEARERRRLQTERENAPKEDRRVRTVDTREIAEKAQSERGRVDRKLAALERKKEELRLADVWESSKAAGEVHKILPKPGSIPGATPAVYEHLKRHMLDKSNEKLAAKQTNAALTESALGPAQRQGPAPRVRDRRFAHDGAQEDADADAPRALQGCGAPLRAGVHRGADGLGPKG
jgi:hypothetical protein